MFRLKGFAYNVKDDLIIRCDQNPVLAFIKTEEGSQPQYAFYEEGTADRLLSADELPALPSGTECAVFGSISMCMEPVASTIESLLAKCRKDGIVIAFDPNIRPFMIKDRMAYMKRFEKWIGICTIAKISSEDFEYIYPGVEPEDALRKIISLGAGLAIVTLGHKGAAALLCRENGSIIEARANGIHIDKTGDTVGAGDTFHGALLAWLHKRGKLSHNAILNLNAEDLNNALLFANKAAAVVCTRFGAQPPSLEEIEN
ncbi:MAG: PfkB family carbohydrate kinase [Treponema sp.]|nr:PfkB family carbohydrate kinase [Treponema sp.]